MLKSDAQQTVVGATTSRGFFEICSSPGDVAFRMILVNGNAAAHVYGAGIEMEAGGSACISRRRHAVDASLSKFGSVDDVLR